MSNFETKFVVITSNYVFSQTEFEGYSFIDLNKFHPKIHLNLLYRIIEDDVSTVIYVNDDVTLSDINSLILLSQFDKEKSVECGYEGYSIHKDDISVYENNTHEKIMYELEMGEFGYQIDWINERITKAVDRISMVQILVEEMEE